MAHVCASELLYTFDMINSKYIFKIVFLQLWRDTKSELPFFKICFAKYNK